jgi:DNA-binding response OmpR family regulator
VSKILLVEDDFSLRDIYGARLEADGHTVVKASDGEEALAVAMREHPELIILDVMMPKISGFDVLDILRSTPDTKTTKVIMMTALGQDADRKRGESLGVNKYLVKSQVTLEDVMNSVKEVLALNSEAAPTTAPKPKPEDPSGAPQASTPPPGGPAPAPLPTTPPAAPAIEPPSQTPPASPQG